MLTEAEVSGAVVFVQNVQNVAYIYHLPPESTDWIWYW